MLDMIRGVLDAIDRISPDLDLRATLILMIFFGSWAVVGIAAFVRLACQAIKGDYDPGE